MSCRYCEAIKGLTSFMEVEARVLYAFDKKLGMEVAKGFLKQMNIHVEKLPNEFYKGKENLSVPSTKMVMKTLFDMYASRQDPAEDMSVFMDIWNVIHNELETPKAKELASMLSDKKVSETKEIYDMIVGAKE